MITVDLWSLGVILFELYKGEPPFYTNNIYSLIQLIIKDKVKYPAGMSRSFKDFLQCLLVKNPDRRITCDFAHVLLPWLLTVGSLFCSHFAHVVGTGGRIWRTTRSCATIHRLCSSPIRSRYGTR